MILPRLEVFLSQVLPGSDEGIRKINAYMDLLHPSGWHTWCTRIYEANMWWVSVIVRQDINYPKLPPRNVNCMDEGRPFQSSDLITLWWFHAEIVWWLGDPHPVPDGQGQILLSNMDTWAPERQLSKSCVRPARILLIWVKRQFGISVFWILWIFVNSHFKPWKPLSWSLCFLIFLE